MDSTASPIDFGFINRVAAPVVLRSGAFLGGYRIHYRISIGEEIRERWLPSRPFVPAMGSGIGRARRPGHAFLPTPLRWTILSFAPSSWNMRRVHHGEGPVCPPLGLSGEF
jgi:hypothetical protein